MILEQTSAIIPKRFGPLDGLRGIAVLMVFLSHTSGRGMSLHNNLNFKGIGHIGVYLFFCLSAYLLGSRLLKSEIDLKAAQRFFIKRIFRIWPLYYSVLIVILILQYGFDYYSPRYLFIQKGWVAALQHFVFYRGDGVFWSVVAEEQFYLIVPILLFLFQRWAKVIVWFCVIVISLNFALYLSKHIGFPVETNWLKYISTNASEDGNYLDVFLGSFLVLFASNAYPDIAKKRYFHVASTLIFAFVLVCSLVLVSENFLGFHRPLYNFRYITIAFVAGFMPFIISLENGNPFVRFLSIPLLKRVGLYGFSFYLLHFLIFDIINTHLNMMTPWMKFFIAFAAVYLVSKASYFLIEKPFIKLGYAISNATK